MAEAREVRIAAVSARPVLAAAWHAWLEGVGCTVVPPGASASAAVVDVATADPILAARCAWLVLVIDPTGADPLPAGLVVPAVRAVVSLADSRDALVEAVVQACSGRSTVSPSAARHVLDRCVTATRSTPAATPIATMTARELDVASAIAEGLSTKATAARLGVSIKTVEAHRARLFLRLRVRTAAQAAAALVDVPVLARRPTE